MARFAKIRFKIPRGDCKTPRQCPSSERMWVTVKHCNSGMCEGSLDNDPAFIRNLTRGQSILFTEADILEERATGLDGILKEHPMLPWLAGGAALLGLLMWSRKSDQSAIDKAGDDARRAAMAEEARLRAAAAAAASAQPATATGT